MGHSLGSMCIPNWHLATIDIQKKKKKKTGVFYGLAFNADCLHNKECFWEEEIKNLASESLIQGSHITERQIKDTLYTIRKHPLNKAKIEVKITFF